jgi:hypothetical protein
MKINDYRIGEMLVLDRVISVKQLNTCLEFQNQYTTEVPIGALLVIFGFITEEVLFHYLRVQQNKRTKKFMQDIQPILDQYEKEE